MAARASIACSLPPATANSVPPSVLTRSGSSIPGSCTLVPDDGVSGDALPFDDPSAVPWVTGPVAGDGAPVAGGTAVRACARA